MSRLVIEVVQSSGSGRKRHFLVREFPARVGRGYHNQVIIDDPYVSPDHVEIAYNDAEGFVITDLGSTNGTHINGERVERTRIRLYSGDHLTVGKTVLRVFEPHHSVLPAITLTKESGIIASMSSFLFTATVFALAMALILIWAYFEQWTDRDDTPRMLARAFIGGAGAILVWAAVWGLAGRLTRHRASFLQQAGAVSLYACFSFVIYFTVTYVDYLTSSGLLTDVTGYALNFLALFWLLSSCLFLATDIAPRKRRVMAGFFSFAVLAAMGIIGYVSAGEFDLSPRFSANLEPYLAAVAPAETVEEFVTASGAVFDSQKLK